MFHIPAEVFALSGEAVVLIRGSKLVYANRRAETILGGDCVGKNVKKVFGPEVSDSQASSFTVDVRLGSEYYTACVSRCDQYQVLFLHRQTNAADYIGERFWLSIREGLMNLGISLELWRARSGSIDDPQLKKSIAAMSKSYYRMSRMVSNLSYVLNCGARKLMPAPAVFDLSTHCRQLVETLTLIYPGTYFSFHCDGDISVYADRSMIDSALLNLFSNALVHGKGCTGVSLSLSESRDSVIISISDDGCGIESQNMHSVFCRYEDGVELSSSGAGFGLTVVRSVARLFGGTVLLESREGHGTTVRMSIARNLPSGMHSTATEYSCGMRHILEGLADVLPAESFEDRYMD